MLPHRIYGGQPSFRVALCHDLTRFKSRQKLLQESNIYLLPLRSNQRKSFRKLSLYEQRPNCTWIRRWDNVPTISVPTKQTWERLRIFFEFEGKAYVKIQLCALCSFHRQGLQIYAAISWLRVFIRFEIPARSAIATFSYFLKCLKRINTREQII